MAATFKLSRLSATGAPASQKVLGNDLAHQLKLVEERKFDGTLAIESAEQQWTLYFSLGHLIWADGGEHPQRRWRRLLFQYCSQNLPSSPLADERERLCCLARWVQEAKLTKDALNPFVRSAASEIVFDLLQQEFHCPYFYFGELPPLLKQLPIVARIPLVKVLAQMKTLWRRWREAGLVQVSPHAAVSLTTSASKSRLAKIHEQTYIKLSRTIDGNKTIADLALLWEKRQIFSECEDPLAAAKWIDTLSKQGWLRLHLGADLGADLSLQPLDEQLKIAPSRPQFFLQEATSIEPNFSSSRHTAIASVAVALCGVSLAFTANSLPGVPKLSFPRSVSLAAISGERVPITIAGERSGFAFLDNPDFQAQMRSRAVEISYLDTAVPSSPNTLIVPKQADLTEGKLSQFLHRPTEGKIVAVAATLGQTDPSVLVASSRLLRQADLLKTIVKAYYLNSPLDAKAALEWINSGKLQRQIAASASRERQMDYDEQYLSAAIAETAALLQSLKASDPQLAEALARRKTHSTFFAR
ncbi:hypothetical protein C7B80_21815 [Cyanosarcina cf. burmensis CCALA 770]|nr:hypothetical protein C7B80_21815 [Cyanosarcina cf. burmensis CCALA 770]